jgi:hypothetical protein
MSIIKQLNKQNQPHKITPKSMPDTSKINKNSIDKKKSSKMLKNKCKNNYKRPKSNKNLEV